MEVITHSPSASPSKDPFDFNRARISPYLSAPSSPKRFGEYFCLSAPSSPSRFFAQFDSLYDLEHPHEHDADHKDKSVAVPEDDDGFAFFVDGESTSPRSAEELFDGGKIKPLIEDDLLDSVKSPLLPPAQPRRSSKKKEGQEEEEERRGRDRSVCSSSSRSRVARSLSPCNRVSHYTWDEESNQAQDNKEGSVSDAVSLSSSSSKSSRKWRFRDFLLFRSASEGRGSSKDPLRKFPAFYKKPQDPKTSIPSPSPGPGPRPRRKEPLSAHELHYARKKAETEDLKKRTYLPYKQGILGRLAGFGSR
ncbi:uncharacterized protein LOC114164235 [Vigna unguiculata]|uniref:Uncharacterized protein n=1 Tax=Vigna unguiculata TaxID=3917 RepID=A0A4D6NW37_VIGUN|nr:uncharacterized protein LOC114164235 [Vigna unguiculata]QCE16555.1 hypothetical protein DEO72_LG11g3572 [Vigna unguiculata]